MLSVSNRNGVQHDYRPKVEIGRGAGGGDIK